MVNLREKELLFCNCATYNIIYAMQENETQRHIREREFQNCVLAALEKPKPNRFLAFINAPFFLWLLSAILLSIGGAYYTNYRQCMADADKLKGVFLITRQKLLEKQIALISPMMKAKSIEELRTLVEAKGEDNKRLAELSGELLGYQKHIDMEPLKWELDRIWRPLTSHPEYSKFQSIFIGVVPPNMNDEDLPAFQRMLIGPFYAVTNKLMWGVPLFRYRCTPGNVGTLMNGYEPLILLRAAPTLEKFDLESLERTLEY